MAWIYLLVRHLFLSYPFAEMLTYCLISYIRWLKPPALYYISTDYQEDDPSLIQKRANIIHSAAALLEKCNLMKYERVSGHLYSMN